MRADRMLPLVVAGVAACTGPAVRRPVDTCAGLLRAVVSGALEDFAGLAPRCTAADAARELGGGEGEAGRGILSGHPTAFRDHDAARVWLDDRGGIVLVVVDEPAWPGEATLLDALGRPEAIIARGWSDHADADQWVYAGRGLTLWVRDGDDPPRIARAAAYVPTTPARYEHELGGRDKTERLPP